MISENPGRFTWLQHLLVKSEAIAGQVECRWVVKWNAISQVRRRNLELKPVLGANCRHKTPDAERSSTGTDDSKIIMNTSFL